MTEIAPDSELYALMLDLGPSRSVRWRDKADALAWIDREIAHWEWIEIKELKNYVVSELRALRTETEKYFEGQGADSACERRLREIYVKRNIPFSTEYKAVALSRWAEEDRHAASEGMNVITDRAISIGNGTQFRNCTKAALISFGIYQAAETAEATVEKLSEEWRNLLNARLTEFDRASLGISTALASTKSNQTEFLEFRNGATKSLERIERSFNEALDGIRKKYREELALRAPVTYWRTRNVDYQTNANTWGLLSIVMFLVALSFGYLAASQIGRMDDDVKQMVREGTLQGTDLTVTLAREWAASLSLTIVVTLFSVWPLRIFLRNYLSHSHLAADAAERVIIVETYLALLNDPDLRDREDLKQQLLPPVLQNLFRHSADGIIKDDAMPWQSIIEAIKQK